MTQSSQNQLKKKKLLHQKHFYFFINYKTKNDIESIFLKYFSNKNENRNGNRSGTLHF